MKQIIDFKSIWFNTKRALYGTMIIVVTLSIPVLSYVGLSHTEPREQTTEMAKNNTAKQAAVLFQKQS